MNRKPLFVKKRGDFRTDQSRGPGDETDFAHWVSGWVGTPLKSIKYRPRAMRSRLFAEAAAADD
jgi:hypothetical protein